MIFGRKVRSKKTYVIMLCGMSAGCGVTNLALSLASYLISCEKRRVCFMEYRENAALASLGTEGIVKCGVPGFTVHGIDVFQVSYQDMEDLKKGKYDVIIIDADSNWDPFWLHTQTLFQADQIMILGEYRPWKYREVQMFMKQLMNHDIAIESGDFYGINVNHAERQHFRAEFHRNVKKLPAIMDPFHLTKQEQKWIGDLLIKYIKISSV